MTSGVSQLGGWLDGLINWLKDAFTDFIVTPLGNFFAYTIGGILYMVQIGFFFVMDVVTCVFRKAAGLDVYYQNGQAVSGDLVMQFLQSSTVQAVFISILVAAIILLFITTFIAVLKVEFDEKDNSKGNIFKSALKAVAYFAIVPVVCFLGVIVSNFVLKMLDGATSRDAVSFSSQVFTASAYNASRVRSDAEFAQEIYNGRNGKFSYIPGIANLSAYDQGKIADLIDDAFRSGATPVAEGGVASFTTIGDTGLGQKTRTFSSFDIGNYQLVFYFYNPLYYNYLIGYIASYMIIMILLKLLIGVICRLYELTILFVLSPLAVSLMPLDGGDRYKSWRGAFVKRVFSAYGPILGLNLVFMILTLLQTVTLFPPDGINGLYNAIMQLIFIFTALVSIRSLVDLVTEMVGQGDALKTGEAVGKEAKQMGLKAVGQAGNLAMMPARAARFAGAKIADNVKTKGAIKDLSFDKNGNIVAPGADGSSRGLEDVSAKDRLKAWGQRRIGTQGRAENQDLQNRVNRRSSQLKNTKSYINDGGVVPIYDEDGDLTGETRNVKLTADRRKKALNDGVKGFAEATPMWNMLKEDSKTAGKGAPILSNISKKFKDDEDAKKRKDTKDDLKMKQEIEEELANEKANKDRSKATSSAVKAGATSGAGATDDDTDDKGAGGTPPPPGGGGGGGGTGGLGTPTSSDRPVPVRIVNDDTDNNYTIDTANLDTGAATITDDAQKAEINIGQASETSNTTTTDANTIDLSGENKLDGDVDANKVDAKDVEAKGKADVVGALGDKKIKIDDSGIRQELRSASSNANNTSRSIQSKLDKIAQSLGKTVNAVNETKGQLAGVKKTVDKIQEDTKKKK